VCTAGGRRAVEVSGTVHEQPGIWSMPVRGRCTAEGVENGCRAIGAEFEHRTRHTRAAVGSRSIEVSGAVHDEGRLRVLAVESHTQREEGVQDGFRASGAEPEDRAGTVCATDLCRSLDIPG